MKPIDEWLWQQLFSPRFITAALKVILLHGFTERLFVCEHGIGCSSVRQLEVSSLSHKDFNYKESIGNCAVSKAERVVLWLMIRMHFVEHEQLAQEG